MWPFNKKITKVPSSQLCYSQVDITKRFEDNLNLNPDEWIKTAPLNSITKDPESSGLPALNADPEKVYEIASRLSAIREAVHNPDDGVYCPVCHIANTQLNKLHSPCPQCGRGLLKFGWD